MHVTYQVGHSKRGSIDRCLPLAPVLRSKSTHKRKTSLLEKTSLPLQTSKEAHTKIKNLSRYIKNTEMRHQNIPYTSFFSDLKSWCKYNANHGLQITSPIPRDAKGRMKLPLSLQVAPSLLKYPLAPPAAPALEANTILREHIKLQYTQTSFMSLPRGDKCAPITCV
jgi:hypothetical protein